MTEKSSAKPTVKPDGAENTSGAKPTVKSDGAGAETRAFQTEVQQLLHLIIHSLYGNKEIFLRELISNAADACDRLRFLALTDTQLLDGADGALSIRIETDARAKTVTVRDNGIGMNYDEVIENIGTIARSGTKKFMQQMSEKDARDSAFIGQFGVGFYSAFLAAKEVTLVTRRADAPEGDGVKWVSTGSGEYSIERITRAERGTEIILSLQSDQHEFLDAARLRTLIEKYSNHISLPIEMQTVSQGDGAGNGDGNENADGNENKSPAWETVNEGSALWAKPKNKISADEYNAFYTSLTYDPQPPAVTLHNRVEGKMEYISLFYIPASAPFDLWDREQRHGIKLYVRRIFIADDAKQLMPNYLRFVRGLIDSADLPLNVSREFLQANDEIVKIRAASVKKVLAALTNIADRDAEKYAALWKEYGRVIKEGVIEDADNRETVVKLLRFASTHNKDDAQTISLDDYRKRMPEKQTAIYYLTADSHSAATASPHLEVFRKHSLEVLLLTDPVDEWVVNHLTAHDDKPLQSVAKGDLDLEAVTGVTGAGIVGADGVSVADKATAQQSEELKPLLEKIKTVLADKVKDVRLSNRLIDSPACLVADSHDMGGNLERILQAIGQDAPVAKPILEINPHHAIVKQIDADDAAAEDWAKVLFDHAALAEGAALKDPGDYVRRVNALLSRTAP